MTNQNNELDELDKILRRATKQCYEDGSRRGSQQSAIEHQAKVAIEALYAPKPVENGELRETIDEVFEGLARYNCNAFTEDTLPNEIPPYVAKERVLSLIRTEKLKLLAEVRERVVGEDESPESIPPTMSAEYHNYVHAQNKLRDEQRYSLTKLEAEL